MTTSIGGTAVRSGYYWNLGKWEITPVERDGGQLPGGRGDKFLRIPVLLVLALLPMLGGLFVVFLPVIGFVLVFEAAVRPIVGLFKKSATELASTVTPGWAPGEAHLTGKRAEKGEEAGAPRADERLETLSKEIEEKRNPKP
ncbi:MAG TPA: hypothetical protein VFR85_03985 [Anaeromyxobacteraceae bacterium]|nr:hypothetical protein [Anaeromyxobacteraceae bacterium]